MDPQNQEFPNEALRSLQPGQLSPDILLKLKQHAEEHRMIQALGLDHSDPYEEQTHQTTYDHPSADMLSKESSLKKTLVDKLRNMKTKCSDAISPTSFVREKLR